MLETILSAGGWFMANYQGIITTVMALLTGVIGVALLFPGEQPEKFLKGVVKMLEKVSKK